MIPPKTACQHLFFSFQTIRKAMPKFRTDSYLYSTYPIKTAQHRRFNVPAAAAAGRLHVLVKLFLMVGGLGGRSYIQYVTKNCIFTCMYARLEIMFSAFPTETNIYFMRWAEVAQTDPGAKVNGLVCDPGRRPSSRNQHWFFLWFFYDVHLWFFLWFFWALFHFMFFLCFFNDYFMILRFFLEILMKSKAKPRKIMKNDETPLNFRKNNKSPKKNRKIIK